VSLVRRTLLAVIRMDYPHQTWLLDDGNRPSMRDLAHELGCRYIARPESVNAKAGNLNNALKYSQAEFFVVFDADHAPARDFLRRTLGYFRDPDVAFVQTPQDFYNLDSYQHRRDRRRGLVWTEQSLFFRVIQRGKDYWNAAFFCGSCAVLRRRALDEVKGFATGTVTEDLETSIRIHRKGFKSVYHARSLAFGIAPSTVVPFPKQRVRWGQGAMQALRGSGILFGAGWTAAQRVWYLATVLTYLDGWLKGVFYLAPVIVLTTGVMPVAGISWLFLAHFIPYYLLTFWAFEEVGRGFGAP
jgi:cellulose synthase (UDP-forming)